MTISYQWLSKYLPEPVAPEKLSHILTSLGLEVESLEHFESVKGGLAGLVTGEVLICIPHPNADKLKLTTVSIGKGEPLAIVCGASNVATGQKVVVAPAGTTIYPTSGAPITLKKTSIRGEQSEGMICAEDEIGLGSSHEGILVLDPFIPAGTKLSDIFALHQDSIFEIGLTPNRTDAMSHRGVARDLCAWMSHQQQKEIKPAFPAVPELPAGPCPVSVTIRDEQACRRYSGISIRGIQVGESPDWLKHTLQSIGVRPINNIVDITNYLLHDTGQPLHAFDEDQIAGKKILVERASSGRLFTSLDSMERKLHEEDLVIASPEGPLCLAGVYGGLNSGVTANTRNIFLESAWFHPTVIRKTSMRHQLRTDAATRFEKGTDISQTLEVLARAAAMVISLAGGQTEGGYTDVYPVPYVSPQISLHFDYLKKISGKEYTVTDIRNIVESLGFGIVSVTAEALLISVPPHKTDIGIPADLAEEIMRVDGLDQVAIPDTIRMIPATGQDSWKADREQQVAQSLTGLGFQEIFTNSIVNSAWFPDNMLNSSVAMINNLSAELNIMRPHMLPGGLQAIAYNLNRKNQSLRFFEWGKTYQKTGDGFRETPMLAIYASGPKSLPHWREKPQDADFYFMKGILERLALGLGIGHTLFSEGTDPFLQPALCWKQGNTLLGCMGEVSASQRKNRDIRQPVFYAEIYWNTLLDLSRQTMQYREISKFPSVQRDLALVIDKKRSYADLEKIALTSNIPALRSVHLFDVFESEKLGAGKKSMAMNFVFMDEEKTLTDQEIDRFLQTLIRRFEQEAGADIRK